MLQFFGGGADGVGPLLLIDQPGGVHGNGVLYIRVHSIVDEGHQDQNHADHEQVHGMEDGLAGGHLIDDSQDLASCGYLEGNGTGDAGVPDRCV